MGRFMSELSSVLPFAAACVVLMLIPGPNVALIVATSVRQGTRFGLLTVAGTASAMAWQLGAVWLGLAGMLGVLGHAFGWVRWGGAAYLVWLGVRQWRGAPAGGMAAVVPPVASPGGVWLRAFAVSSCNPKTMLFYGAFFPSFMPAGGGVASVGMLCATFLSVAVVVDGGWAMLAGRAAPLLLRRGRLGNRIAGGVLIGAAAGLALEGGR